MGKKSGGKISRRSLLKAAGATGAAAALEGMLKGTQRSGTAIAAEKKQGLMEERIIEQVSAYIARSGGPELPAPVVQKAKHHILDTLAAMVCGSTMKPGQQAMKFARSQGGVEEAQVIGSSFVTSAINAALANGMMGHADETDDSHEPSVTHPGCAIVPAALAMAERVGADGMRFLKGVVAGYDIGPRLTMALDSYEFRARFHATHSFGGTFGAAAAAASVLGLREDQVRIVLDYAGQQASGVTYWARDEEHVEKAFVFGGMPARNGVTAATFVHLGFSGVRDLFTGERNFLAAHAPVKGKPERLVEGLGKRYEIMFTNIKKYSVGSPIQAPLDALTNLIKKHGLRAQDVESITARVPDDSLNTVNDRDMPDINLQYMLAVTLIDGDATFAAAHSHQRMTEPAVLALRKRITAIGDHELTIAKIKRGGIVEITTKDGAKLREHVERVRGTASNPMTTEEMEKKSLDLLAPVLGKEGAQRLIDKIWNLEKVKNVRELRPFLSGRA